MALSSLVVLFVLYRTVPHKGKLLAGAALFGSSFLATVRWLFGVWLPSWHQVGDAATGAASSSGIHCLRCKHAPVSAALTARPHPSCHPPSLPHACARCCATR